MPARNPGDIRSGQRRAFEGAVQVSWHARTGEARVVRARCVDLSEQGIRIVSEHPIDLRTSVYLQAPAFGLMGNATVRYCRRMGAKHSIGLMFSTAVSLADAGRKRCLSQEGPDVEKA